MPPKILVTTLGQSTSRRDNNTSIVNNNTTQDSQLVTMGQLRGIVDQMNNNQQALDNKISEMGLSKVKLPSIERFDGTRSKLKGFLSQIWFKITQEKAKM